MDNRQLEGTHGNRGRKQTKAKEPLAKVVSGNLLPLFGVFSG